MPAEDRRVRARDRIEHLARAGHDTVGFCREATEVLRTVVPFDFHPCWFTLDPAYLLITGHFNAGLPRTPPEILHGQYAEDDVNAFTDLARSRVPAATVRAATGGDPAASWRWTHVLQPSGFDDALDAALRVRGTTWGALSLLHTSGRRPFTAADVRFVARVAPALATGLRLGLLLPTAGEPPVAGTAVLVVSDGLEVSSATSTAAEWLDALPGGADAVDGLPVPVQAAVVRARSTPEGRATVCLRDRAGRWVRIQATGLTGARAGETAVVLDAAGDSTVPALLLAAHELTPRERDVVDLVLRGRSTEQIADALVISAYTVQDRLKAVFEKLGVRSRRELVAQVHATRARPLVDDNDDRLRSGRSPAAAPVG